MGLDRQMNREQKCVAAVLLKHAKAQPEISTDEFLDGMGKPGLFHAIMSHDHDCPATETNCAADCNCQPEISLRRDVS